MNDDATLADALQTLAEDLQTLIEECLAQGNLSDAGQLRRAKFELQNAASDIDAANITNLFNGNADFAKLTSLTSEIATKANAIAGDEKNVARIVGIAAGAVTIAAAAGSGNVAAVIKGASDLAKIID